MLAGSGLNIKMYSAAPHLLWHFKKGVGPTVLKVGGSHELTWMHGRLGYQNKETEKLHNNTQMACDVTLHARCQYSTSSLQSKICFSWNLIRLNFVSSSFKMTFGTWSCTAYLWGFPACRGSREALPHCFCWGIPFLTHSVVLVHCSPRWPLLTLLRTVSLFLWPGSSSKLPLAAKPHFQYGSEKVVFTLIIFQQNIMGCRNSVTVGVLWGHDIIVNGFLLIWITKLTLIFYLLTMFSNCLHYGRQQTWTPTSYSKEMQREK